jgi:hypothetical protein
MSSMRKAQRIYARFRIVPHLLQGAGAQGGNTRSGKSQLVRSWKMKKMLTFRMKEKEGYIDEEHRSFG